MSATECYSRKGSLRSKKDVLGLAMAARVCIGFRDGAGKLCVEHAAKEPQVCVVLSPHSGKNHLQHRSSCLLWLIFEPLKPWAPGTNTLGKTLPHSFSVFHLKSGRRTNLQHNMSQKTHLMPLVSHELVAEHSHLHKVLCIKIGRWKYSWQMVLNIEPVTDWPHREAPLLLVKSVPEPRSLSSSFSFPEDCGNGPNPSMHHAKTERKELYLTVSPTVPYLGGGDPHSKYFTERVK